MLQTIQFYWRCSTWAARGTVELANAWFWAIGVPIVAIVGDYLTNGQLIIPDNVPEFFTFMVLTVAATWVVFFALRFVVAPAFLYREEVSKNQEIVEEVANLLDADHGISRLSDLYHEGRRLYSEYDDFDTWKTKMERWQNEVEQFISNDFSISELHEFRKDGSGFEYGTEWKWDGIEPNKALIAKASISARLSALNDMIRYASTGYLPRKVRLSDLIGKGDGGHQPKDRLGE